MSALLVVGLLLGVLAGRSAEAAPGEGRGVGGRSLFRCDVAFEDLGAMARHPSSVDLYDGLVFLGGVAGITLHGDTPRRWTARNDFDVALRHDFRLGGVDRRRSADLASDLTLASSVGLLPLSGILASQVRTGDCVETWDMATDWFESFGVALFASELVKQVAGRERPFVRSCDRAPPSDADCSGDDRRRSFVSGHSTLAAAGAGVTCAFAFRRSAWGSSMPNRVAPCALGVGLAVATGALRMAADRHWGTDVIAGLTIGALVGSFDTWGPFELLRFAVDRGEGAPPAQGLLLPDAGGRALGARVLLVF